MKYSDFRAIGSPVLLALTIVSAVSLSARLYKEDMDAQKALAAGYQTTAVACAMTNQL